MLNSQTFWMMRLTFRWVGVRVVVMHGVVAVTGFVGFE